MRDLRTVAAMGTAVTIEVIGGGDPVDGVNRRDAIDRALAWFASVESCCSRFDPDSELARLAGRTGDAIPVSPMLFEAVSFALAVAENTRGAFDPTVGHRMQARGFDRNFRTGRAVETSIGAADDVSFRDVAIDRDRRTITCRRPLTLDLGSVAKGLAIDMAARELRPFEHYAIDAGGDLYLAGRNAQEKPWAVGIRHPRDRGRLLGTLRVSDRAVCTSGDYERAVRHPGGGHHSTGHHITNPGTGEAATGAASVTVVAPTAMLADALGTAAFVLGPGEGLALLERQGVDGLIVSDTLERHATRGLRDYDYRDDAHADAIRG